MMFGRNKGAAAVVERIPEGSVGVEIGVWKGDSSELFLERAGHLHLVDPWSIEPYRTSDEFGDFRMYLHRYSRVAGGSSEADFQRYYDSVYESVCKRFDGKSVTIHRCTSAAFFHDFREEADWFYIDGSHSFDGCLSDLEGAWEITTHAIFGDDYGTKPGVTKAVDFFLQDKACLKLDIFGGDQYQIRL
jgi:hypothetical protein